MKPIPTDPIRIPDMHYWNLHAKCAAGTLNPVERIELDALCAIKEAEWANADAPRFRASHGASDESPPSGLQSLSQGEE